MKTFAIIILLIIFITSAYLFFKYEIDSQNSAAQFNELQNIIISQDISSDTEISNSHLEEIKDINNDFVAWISIQNTNVSYPVMQTYSNPNFYLNHDFSKTSSDFGVPYLDSKCDISNSNNLIIYGHNMNNGMIFEPLLEYRNLEYLKTHNIITLDSLYSFTEYEILYVFDIDLSYDTFDYSKYTDMDTEQFEEFISEIDSRSLYSSTSDISTTDELLTLSTCDYSYSDGRFVVIAKKINETIY